MHLNSQTKSKKLKQNLNIFHHYKLFIFVCKYFFSIPVSKDKPWLLLENFSTCLIQPIFLNMTPKYFSKFPFHICKISFILYGISLIAVQTCGKSSPLTLISLHVWLLNIFKERSTQRPSTDAAPTISWIHYNKVFMQTKAIQFLYWLFTFIS